MSVVAGIPEIVGVWLAAAFTEIEKDGSDTDPLELVAVMTILLKIPAVVNIPLNAPFAALNVIPGGMLPVMLKLLALVAVGVKL